MMTCFKFISMLVFALLFAFKAESITPENKHKLPVRLRAERSATNQEVLTLGESLIDATFHQAKELLTKRRKLENLQGHVTDMKKRTAVTRHQEVTTTLNQGNELEKSQEIFEEMTKLLAKNLSTLNEPLEAAATGMALARIELMSSPETRRAVQTCRGDQYLNCDPYRRYRTADGSCNNLDNPEWGKSFTCFTRLLPPAYSDGLSAPRYAVDGGLLPNARLISAVMHRDLNYPAIYTHMTMQFGQFFAHDIAFTPSSRTIDGKMIQCCPPDVNNHPQCYPIQVAHDDPFYGNYKEDCLNFVRTAMCPQCKMGPREQMNQITSFIDGSMIYGSMDNVTRSLWTKTGPAGRMHVSIDSNGGELLPQSTEPDKDQCSKPDQNLYCFKAGDKRVNQHPALTSLHVIFLRQHNRLVNHLKEVNVHWDGETLYNEAKKIIGAQLQMITYSEWLPLILGPDAMKFLNLNVLYEGYTNYDPYTHPGIINEFSSAAFRFGHSLVNSVFAEILHNGKPSGYRLRENFFTPFGLYGGQLDAVIKGLISQAAQNRDPFVSMDMKNHLYRPKDSPYGLDLPAFNIQRGRDHGISGYTSYLKFCFDEKIHDWSQLDQYIPMSQRLRFQKIYNSVHDIDLFTAGLAEYPLPGAAVGPTFVCIIGIQMYNLKFGDRFWFEHGKQAGSFTAGQLQQIRKTSLAKIICENSDDIEYIQKNVFKGESKYNEIVPCKTLPDLDLNEWRENQNDKNGYEENINENFKPAYLSQPDLDPPHSLLNAAGPAYDNDNEYEHHHHHNAPYEHNVPEYENNIQNDQYRNGNNNHGNYPVSEPVREPIHLNHGNRINPVDYYDESSQPNEIYSAATNTNSKKSQSIKNKK